MVWGWHLCPGNLHTRQTTLPAAWGGAGQRAGDPLGAGGCCWVLGVTVGDGAGHPTASRSPASLGPAAATGRPRVLQSFLRSWKQPLVEDGASAAVPGAQRDGDGAGRWGQRGHQGHPSTRTAAGGGGATFIHPS